MTERRLDDDELVIYVAICKASMPMLHGDLMRFRKGPKRVQRLRMLALQGLFFEARPVVQGKTLVQPKRLGAAGEIFEEPVDE